MEKETDTHPKDQETEHENPSTSVSDESSGVADETSPATQERVAQSPAKDGISNTSESAGQDGATSTPAGASAADVGGSDIKVAPTDNSHVFNESWSKLPRDVIVDKIKGVIYGQAIGDAFGTIKDTMNNYQTPTYLFTMIYSSCRTCY